jgi:hypothetical protein
MSFRIYLAWINRHFPSSTIILTLPLPTTTTLCQASSGGIEIFDSSNPQISQIDAWNEGWVYVKNPQDCKYLRGLRHSFTPLQSGKKSTLGDCLPSASDIKVINKIRVLVEGIIFYSQYF